MSESGDKFIRNRKETDSKISGDYIVWKDGRRERITDPNYWVARQEIQRRIGDR